MCLFCQGLQMYVQNPVNIIHPLNVKFFNQKHFLEGFLENVCRPPSQENKCHKFYGYEGDLLPELVERSWVL